MIQLRMMLEDKPLNMLYDQFILDFKMEIDRANVNCEYFGYEMIIKKEYIVPLVITTKKYLLDVLGIEIADIDIVGYYESYELPINHSIHVQIDEQCGFNIRGFYDLESKTIYVKIGEHFKILMPTLFHELTHAYIHTKNIKIIDDFPMPTQICFDFASLMHKASQEEGLCELVSTLMSYHIFDINQYPSNIDKYWLGWRLCMEGFLTFAKMIIYQFKDKDNLWITRLSFISLINQLKQNNNLYKFVNMVPKDAYNKTK